MSDDRIQLVAGGGGRNSRRLINGLFFKYFANPLLNSLDDAALLRVSSHIAMSTGSFMVDPLEFPGGNIGSLAVLGTANNVAMLGARPEYLTCGFIIEEGFSLAAMERVLKAMSQAAMDAEVRIVAGDTKVAPKGSVDKILINTTGIGRVIAKNPPGGKRAEPGDVILLSGALGEHGLAILAARRGLELNQASDLAALNHMAEALVTNVPSVHVLRDPSRGGLAAALGWLAEQSGLYCEVEENSIPVKESVRLSCAKLGLDPLYLPNAGKLLCILPPEGVERALEVMGSFFEGRHCAKIGRIRAEAPPAAAQDPRADRSLAAQGQEPPCRVFMRALGGACLPLGRPVRDLPSRMF